MLPVTVTLFLTAVASVLFWALIATFFLFVSALTFSEEFFSSVMEKVTVAYAHRNLFWIVLRTLSPSNILRLGREKFHQCVERWITRYGYGYDTIFPRSHAVCYVRDGRQYAIVWPKRRGPCWWDSVCTMVDEKESDVVENILCYAGPFRDFHGIPTTPRMLGYRSLKFYCRERLVREFMADETIVNPG